MALYNGEKVKTTLKSGFTTIEVLQQANTSPETDQVLSFLLGITIIKTPTRR